MMDILRTGHTILDFPSVRPYGPRRCGPENADHNFLVWATVTRLFGLDH